MNTPQVNTPALLAHVRDIHSVLSAHRGNMVPQPALNHAFGGLVGMARMGAVKPMVVSTILAELENSETLSDLHSLCAEGEFALEQHWADKIKNAVNPKSMLRSFPYWTNYLKLAKLEMNTLRKVQPDVQKVLFVGAGPLPLTAYLFASHYGLDVTNLEVEESAACCALEWMEPILGTGKIPCHHMDVMDFTDFGKFDVVVLAALVGIAPAEKHRILAHLNAHMHADQLLMVRSVRGLRRLLYPVVGANDLNGFEVVKEVHPRGEVVNSVVIARKAA